MKHEREIQCFNKLGYHTYYDTLLLYTYCSSSKIIVILIYMAMIYQS